MSILEITHKGIQMDVEFDYTPFESATWDDPGSSEGADICSVTVGGVDISDLLREDDLIAIEKNILDRIGDAKSEGRLDAAIADHESRQYYHDLYAA